ncbi:MAG TPA: hypothetical protein VGQ67_03460 [Candidatus Polarisedimenticolia bacterium]|jgi:hypothetical protein|nr:hypothetical protein [Candidatus Polarisedimenticolia bacterium]
MRVPLCLTLLVCFSLAGCTAAADTRAAAADPASARPAPEFAHIEAADWLNSAPLSMKGLRGHVVVLDVWTFG